MAWATQNGARRLGIGVAGANFRPGELDHLCDLQVGKLFPNPEGNDVLVVRKELTLNIVGLNAIRRGIDQRSVLDTDHGVGDLPAGRQPDAPAHLARAGSQHDVARLKEGNFDPLHDRERLRITRHLQVVL